jgi:hypothetical protein
MKSEYDIDLDAWSRQLSTLLRRLASGQRVNDTDLDWPNIADEIEAVARSDMHPRQSHRHDHRASGQAGGVACHRSTCQVDNNRGSGSAGCGQITAGKPNAASTSRQHDRIGNAAGTENRCEVNRRRSFRWKRLSTSERDIGSGILPPPQCPSACTISSVIFLASPNSIIVFGRKNNSLSTPA